MEEKEVLKKLKADSFTKNNGIVLRAINIGRISYNRLGSLCRALDTEMDRAEFTDCINYLSQSGYILLRRCDSKVSADIADNDIGELEAKVSPLGIRLLAGKLPDPDPCVEA